MKPEEQQNAHPDEHHGLGGRYVVVNGERRLVQRTEETPAESATAQPVPAPAAPLPQAKAGKTDLAIVAASAKA